MLPVRDHEVEQHAIEAALLEVRRHLVAVVAWHRGHPHRRRRVGIGLRSRGEVGGAERAQDDRGAHERRIGVGHRRIDAKPYGAR